MNIFVTIFLALLSFISGGDRTSLASDRNFQYTDAVIQCTDNDDKDQKADFNDVAILPVKTASYSGDGNGFAPSFRSTSSGRRVQPTTKFNSRVIKDGKVIDRHNFYTFQTELKQFSSGIHSSFRYIYSLCQLLI